MTTFWKSIRLMVAGCLFLLLLLPLLAGCQITHRDETRIAEAQARTDTANAQAREAQARADGLSAQAAAEAAAAEAKAAAAVGVAQANSQTAIVREQEKTTRETAWLDTLPLLLGIVVLGGGIVGGVWLVLWFRGRAHLVMVQAQAATMLPGPQPLPALPRSREVRPDRMLPGPVARRARETGTEAVPSGACWLLVDVGGNVVEVMERRG